MTWGIRPKQHQILCLIATSSGEVSYQEKTSSTSFQRYAAPAYHQEAREVDMRVHTKLIIFSEIATNSFKSKRRGRNRRYKYNEVGRLGEEDRQSSSKGIAAS